MKEKKNRISEEPENNSIAGTCKTARVGYVEKETKRSIT